MALSELAQDMRRHLYFSQAKSESLATRHDHYRALALAVRDRLLQSWVQTAEAYTQARVRTAVYLSAEYLLGPHLDNNLVNLGIRREAEQACRELDLDLEELLVLESIFGHDVSRHGLVWGQPKVSLVVRPHVSQGRDAVEAEL